MHTMKTDTKKTLNLFALIWTIILAVPTVWLVMPVQKDIPEDYVPTILKDYIMLTKQSSLTKQDMIEKHHIPVKQLYVINKNHGRSPFSTGKYAVRTTNTRLKNDISYDRANDEKTSNKKYILNGLSYSDERKVAIINDQVLKEGDKINDAQLVKILENSVVIYDNGTNITLTLKEHTPQ